MKNGKIKAGLFGGRHVALIVVMLIAQKSAWAQRQDFPYGWSKNDYYLLPATLGIYVTSQCLDDSAEQWLSLEEIGNLDGSDVNWLDRWAIDHRNTTWGSAGDVLSSALPMLPLALAIPQVFEKQWGNALVYGHMYLEVYFLTEGITSITKSLVKRTRPFYYNTAYSPEERYEMQGAGVPEGNTSFFSGHTSRAFASAVFLSKTFTDIYGSNLYSTLIWGASLSAAAITAFSRIADGEHFLTDVAAGALVGSAIGYFLPVLHKRKMEEVSFTAMPNAFFLSYRF